MDTQAEQVIESCRNSISEIDRQIFTLIKQREALSAQIGTAKRELKKPIRDFKREKRVFETAINLAHELELPTDTVVELQKLIIQCSLRRQEQDHIAHHKVAARYSVLVVGGSGRLGTWLCHFFADLGHTVSVADPKVPNFSCTHHSQLPEDLNRFDIIVLATPIRATHDIVVSLCADKVQKPVIMDVSSVKTPIQQALKNLTASGVKITSIHPMFGPSVRLLFGKHVIRTSLGNIQADQLVDELFSATTVHVVDMSITEHDKTIAQLLTLSHLAHIVFAQTVSASKTTVSYLEKFSSPTFSHLLEGARKVVLENPHLYFEIQALNPHTQPVYDIFEQSLKEITDAVRSLDEAQFVKIMKQARHFLVENSARDDQ